MLSSGCLTLWIAVPQTVALLKSVGGTSKDIGDADVIKWANATLAAAIMMIARFAMFFVFVFTAVFMIFSGFAMYGEGLQRGSWADKLFGWVIPLMGQSQDVHTWHHLGMWLIIVFVILHVYAAIREDIMGRQSIVSTMISGYRTFKD